MPAKFAKSLGRTLDARPDRLDLRDREFTPNVVSLPQQWPDDATIRRLSQNLEVTFVIVTHDLGSVFVAMDRVILLDRKAKGIIAEGDPRRLRDETTDPRVRAFFRREAEPVAP